MNAPKPPKRVTLARMREVLCVLPDGRLFRKDKGRVTGTSCTKGRLQVTVRADPARSLFFVHHVVWFLAHGSWPESQIDHINGDFTDNRPCNLRLADPSQQSANRTRLRKGKLGVRGVHLQEPGKYVARISWRRKVYHLGTFPCEESAELAYLTAGDRLFGAFAPWSCR